MKSSLVGGLVEQSAHTAMLCSVFARIGIGVGFFRIFAVFFGHFEGAGVGAAALPPGAEDEIVLIEHLPGRRVHLQDFFWTGAEDAPPWLDPDQTLNFYETRTIHHTATVYVPVEDNVPGPNENIPNLVPKDPGCTNCIDPTPTLGDPDQDIGVLVGDDPGPRYWLLTVLRSGESVPPKVELRLARLYRAAFARQQQRHLGLLATDPRLRRATKRKLTGESHKNVARKPSATTASSLATESPKKELAGIRMREVRIPKDSEDFLEIDQTTEMPDDPPEFDILFPSSQIDEYDLEKSSADFFNDFDEKNSKNRQNSEHSDEKSIIDNSEEKSSMKTSGMVQHENSRFLRDFDEKSEKNRQNNQNSNEKPSTNDFSSTEPTKRTSGFFQLENSRFSTDFHGKIDKNPENTQTPETMQHLPINSNVDRSTTDFPLIESSTKVPGVLNYLKNDNPRFFADFSEENGQNNLNGPIVTNDKPPINVDGQLRIKRLNESSDNGTDYMKDLTESTGKVNSTNSRLRTAGMGLVQVRMQNTTILEDGSTRLIYSVHLGGKPVPAETAAKDMALLSPQEVALELGAPVIIQSEPYLKESRPLALSRRRDAWLLVGAASVALILLLVLAGIILALKKRKAHSSVSAPPTQSILKKERGGYTPTTPGIDNTGYTSETEGRTEGTSQRQTPGTTSRTPATPITPDTLDDEIHELSSDNNEDDKDEEDIKKQDWDIEEYPISGKKSRAGRRRMARTNAIETPASPDSLDTMDHHKERHHHHHHQHRDSLENGCIHTLEETASPHSYLSMPSCKLFPSMRSVEPLSRILEPVVVRHLDMEFETPEMSRRGNGFRESGDELLGRTRSALKDPGVVGPIVWDLRRQRAVEESMSQEAADLDQHQPPPSSGAVGRARRRLHELLEDSFSLFSTREINKKETSTVSSTLRPSSAAISHDRITMNSESRGKSAHVSPVGSPIDYGINHRPRTSVMRSDETIPETGKAGPQQPRGAWGSRPMSAGPFHRPNLPEVDVGRVLADSQLAPEDPAVPLIAAIRKELEKFTPERV